MSISIVAGSLVVDTFGNIRVTDDGLISVFDLIQVCANYEWSKSRYRAWDSLCAAYPEVSASVQKHKFPGKGQKEVPVVTKEAALKIIGLLPSTTGKKYRELAAKLVLTYLENPSELAQAAIARVKQPEELKKVNNAVRQRYLELGYRPAMEQIKERADGEQWAYTEVNRLTTKAVTGQYPKEVQAMRYTGTAKNPPSARKLMTDMELTSAEYCHSAQAMSLEKKEINGASNVVKECSRIADEFAEFLKRAGI